MSSGALPCTIVTGASGFLGRRLVRALCADQRVVAIDRLPETDATLAQHPNVRWLRIDLADADAVREALDGVRRAGGARAVVHLAAYYDFTGEDHPEYERTNVRATRRLLESSVDLGLRRFVLASSVAACSPPPPGETITEDTPPDGRHPYSASKRKGEAMVRELADRVPSCTVRLAALFSDWCEYPPLYSFLETWLSDRWDARMLGGRGRSAVPYLHAREATRFFLRVLERADDLDRHETLLASPDGAVSHRELFDVATGCAFGEPRRAIHVPRPLCGPGMWARDLAGRLLGSRPFERPWMAPYVDTRLDVDASRTRRRLGWSCQPRLDVLRRVPFMIEHMRSDPVEWFGRNREILEHRDLSPAFRVYRLVQKHEEAVAAAVAELVRGPVGERELPSYRKLPPDDLRWAVRLMVGSLVQAIRTGSRGAFMAYCRDTAARRRALGFEAAEVVAAMRTLGRIYTEALGRDPEGAGLERAVREQIAATIEFGIDQVLEVYEAPDEEARPGPGEARPGPH